MPIGRNKIDKNLQKIRQEIAAACQRAGRSPAEVRIVAVTKTVEVDAIKALLDLGVTDLGESRAQQLAERAEQLQPYIARHAAELPGPVRWHMIGHLQRNKVKPVLENAQVIHSVDSLRLAEDISVRAQRMERVVEVLLEVNCSQEPQKSGCAVGAAMHMAELISTLKNIRLAGLMTMAPIVPDPQQARPTFALLRELFEEIRHEKIGGEHFRHLSMGMSQDYCVAVEEGATLVRIGTALFE